MNSSTQIPLVQVEVPRELIDEEEIQLPLYVKSTKMEQVAQILDIYKSLEIAKPSIMAELPIRLDDKNVIISIIDNKFLQAFFKDYKKSFKWAAFKDFSNSHSPRNASKDFCEAMCQGAVWLAQMTPNIAVVKHIVGPVLMFLGAVWGGLRSNSYVAEIEKEDNSADRNKWFEEIFIREKVRITESIKLIQKRADTIFEDLNDMKDIIDGKLTSELRILAIFMNYFSPETPLRVNQGQVLVLEYLQQYEIEDEDEEKGKEKEKLVD